MIIEITKCNTVKPGLFLDFSNYDTIDRWLMSMAQQRDASKLYNMTVILNGKSYRTIRDGIMSHYMTEVITKVKSLALSKRHIPSDDVHIKLNAFDRDLVIEFK